MNITCVCIYVCMYCYRAKGNRGIEQVSDVMLNIKSRGVNSKCWYCVKLSNMSKFTKQLDWQSKIVCNFQKQFGKNEQIISNSVVKSHVETAMNDPQTIEKL